MPKSDPSLLNNKHELVTHGYTVEAGHFLEAIKEVGLKQALEIFRDYRSFLNKHRKTVRTNPVISKAEKSGEPIPVSGTRSSLGRLFSIAQLAACCHLFRGWDIPAAAINTTDFIPYVNEKIHQLLATQSNAHENLSTRLRVADSLRTIQILKLSGLLPVDGRHWKQLSPGAGVGNKELEGIHILPKMGAKKILHPGISINKKIAITFNVDVIRPKNIVLIDNEPGAAELYKHLSATQADWILALNEGFHTAISKLPGLLAEKDFGQRNALIAIQIDPMIDPDVNSFLATLAPVLDTKVTLLITVGAGNNIDEFRQRIAFIEALSNYLRKLGETPITFRMHAGSDWEQKWSNPSFCTPPFATFEMLYCKMESAKL